MRVLREGELMATSRDIKAGCRVTRIEKPPEEGWRDREKNDQKGTLRFNALILKTANQRLFLPSKISQSTCHWGNFSSVAVPVLSLTLDHLVKASSYCPFRDSIFMFTGGRRHGDRISPSLWVSG